MGDSGIETEESEVITQNSRPILNPTARSSSDDLSDTEWTRDDSHESFVHKDRTVKVPVMEKANSRESGYKAGKSKDESSQPLVQQPLNTKQAIQNGEKSKVKQDILVDVQMSDDSENEEIPLSWQSSKRVMREQLRDGFNLELESDNEDLDLIPPKAPTYGAGICSCSSSSCSIS